MDIDQRFKLFSSWTSQLDETKQFKQAIEATNNLNCNEFESKLFGVILKIDNLYNNTCNDISNALKPLNKQTIKLFAKNSKCTQITRNKIQSIYLKIDELCFDIERLKVSLIFFGVLFLFFIQYINICKYLHEIYSVIVV